MKSGFVAIVGPTNVGKSTFMNQVLGFKLAITSDKPQTTRNRLLGVHTQGDLQMAFVDTPGFHQARKALNRRMMETAVASLEDVDAVLFVTDVSGKGMEAGQRAAEVVKRAKVPVVVALNKIDLLEDKAALLPMMQRAAGWGNWAALVPISALKRDGTEAVIKELARVLPEAEPMFPADTLTDLPERFLVAEMVREKIFRLTGQEVPYSTAVTVDEFLEPREDDGRVAVSATIHVESQGQKAIIIGKRGAMIKRIGTEARQDMQRLLGLPVFLDLFVRVEPKWSHRDSGLGKMGY